MKKVLYFLNLAAKTSKHKTSNNSWLGVASVGVLLVILASNIDILVFTLVFARNLFANWYLSATYLQIDYISELSIIILLQKSVLSLF